jgi:hypothetical protein
MERYLFGLVVAVLVALPVGCSNPVAPDQRVILDVTKLDAPATIAAGTPLTVVLAVTTGGCRTFDHIEVVRTSSGASLFAWGTDVSVGRVGIACPADIRIELHSYTFDPPFQSTFSLWIARGRLAPLTATVQVQ